MLAPTAVRHRAAWVIALVALAGALFYIEQRNFPDQLGMDLYHPWGIEAVRRIDPGAPNPYLDPGRYGEDLRPLIDAARATSPKLWATADLWATRTADKFEPTATPFYYAVFSVLLPRDYDRAHLAMALLEFAAAATAIAILARLGGWGWLPAWCLALFVELTFTGFTQDIKGGNVNAVQLLVFVGFLYAAQRQAWLRHPWIDRLFLAAVALALVFKPNVVWLGVALAAHYALARGPRAFAIAAAIALVAAALAVAAGAWHFGALHAWSDWARYTMAEHGRLEYTVDSGNISLAMLIAEKSSSFGLRANCAMLAAAFAVALVAAATDSGKRQELLLPVARRVVSDSWFALSLAVVFTFATTPIFWHHYYLMGLIPIAYLLRPALPWSWRAGCAVAAFVVLTTPWMKMLSALGLAGLANSFAFFAWVPLFAALVSCVALERHALERAFAPAR